MSSYFTFQKTIELDYIDRIDRCSEVQKHLYAYICHEFSNGANFHICMLQLLTQSWGDALSFTKGMTNLDLY